MLRRILIVLGAVVITACGGGGSSPAAPSPSTAGVTISGLVFNALLGLSSGVANARVEIATGADAGRAATTDPTKSSR